MLRKLIICNYALIERTEISFDEGMSVITGETGAGKSIMLGALGLLLGQKADVQVLLDKSLKCVVEATFDVSDYGLQPLFDEEGIDYDDETIVRREILPNGKSRAFVNDTPANVSFLKAIGAHLIDIHSQHQNTLLSQSSFQLDVVDSVAGVGEELSDYVAAYERRKATALKLDELKESNRLQKKEFDWNKHQLNELEAAQLKDPDEIEELEKQQELCDRSEEIKESLGSVIDILSADEVGVTHKLLAAGRQIEKVADFINKEDKVDERIETARIDLDDICQTLRSLYENAEFDPETQQKVTERLNKLNGLTQKHGVQSARELIEIRDDLKAKVAAVENFDYQLEELQRQLDDETKVMLDKAAVLTDMRMKVVEPLTERIVTPLHEMGMQNARFIVEVAKQDCGPKGADDVKFLFAANKNGVPTDISKVASGGEMSRVMLSIKALLSKTKRLPTIIFDEIDTGVSGEVAAKMGGIMEAMSESMQVISITHLPQVAAHGNRHYRVFKQDTSDRTISHIALLDDAERVTEIAKMLSGAQVTDAARENAKQLLSGKVK
ncbi:MAG: DNA repair protein RecN [Bacteroidales bacterium]|nr:DNA repair protein RecN [Bacteroidales bacterium]